MQPVISGILQGFQLLFTGDRALWQIILTSAQVSGAALVVSALIGIPCGAVLGLKNFRGKRIVQSIIYTGMGIPPVVVGLFVYLFLSRNGVLGSLNQTWIPDLFTIPAMVIAQILIATPLIVGYTMSAVAEVSPDLRIQLRSLGASRIQATAAILSEARLGVVVAIVGGLGSIISEVGAVMMVGGNIQGSTRVLTTAIMLESRQGNFGMAIGLGIVLLILAFIINAGLAQLQGKGK